MTTVRGRSGRGGVVIQSDKAIVCGGSGSRQVWPPCEVGKWPEKKEGKDGRRGDITMMLI